MSTVLSASDKAYESVADFRALVKAVNRMVAEEKDCGFYNDEAWIKAYEAAVTIARKHKNT